MGIAMDIVLIIVLLLCVWNGYKKGLVLCIGTILAIIVSLYVGDLLSDTFSPAVKPVLKPFVSGYMDGTEGVISDSLDDLLDGNTAHLSVTDATAQYPEIKRQLCINSFKGVGVYTSAAEKMADEAIALSESSGVLLTSAIVETVCSNFTYVLGFIVFFVISLIVLTVLGNIFNLSLTIPGKEQLNTIGGAVTGGVTGLLFCFLIVWALRFSGMLLPEAVMRHTLLTALFLKINFFSAVLTV